MSSELTGRKSGSHEQLIRRMACLPYFNQLGEDGIRALRDHLKSIAPNMDLANSVVGKALLGDHVPTPAELSAICSELQDTKQVLPPGCEICEGQPWITIQKRIVGPDGVPYMADGSKRCSCAKGQWFQQKDRENRQKRELGLPV